MLPNNEFNRGRSPLLPYVCFTVKLIGFMGGLIIPTIKNYHVVIILVQNVSSTKGTRREYIETMRIMFFFP